MTWAIFPFLSMMNRVRLSSTVPFGNARMDPYLVPTTAPTSLRNVTG